jgi:hypothetical protein
MKSLVGTPGGQNRVVVSLQELSSLVDLHVRDPSFRLSNCLVILDSMEPLIFILILAGVAAIAYLVWRAKQKRREALALFALQQGFEFSRDDVVDMASYDFSLFQRGDGRGWENVMSGNWQDLPVKEADYWYYTESTDSKGNRSRTYHRFSVVVAEVACHLPSVTMAREDTGSWLAGHMGFHDIEFESDRFNRMFKVTARDREFAYRLIDARMIRWLESVPSDVGFEVNGSDLLVWSKRRRPSELVPLFGSARMFCDHIPRLVWTEYGSGPSPAPEEERSSP